MGLLEQKWRGLMSYIEANTPKSSRPVAKPSTVIDQGLLGGRIAQIPQRAAEIKQGIMNIPQDLAQLTSPEMKQTIADAWAGKGKPVNPQQWIDAGMELSGMAPVGALAGIVKPEVAKGLNTLVKLPDDDIFKAAVANTPGAQLDDAGLLMRVQRNQRPEQGMQPSVRGGVFYLPEGAAQAKHYSTGKTGYGGSEKISGETLVSNPLFAKGGTGGKAPESAYDSLIGKGAYQAMRTDALKGYGGFGATHADKVKLVSEFLGKYAPELADQADYIVRNSGQGNQLAYALQEAAVGSAVRNAGHDAVLGYSKGKSGPFISELFDVRESAYPDKFGGSQVWDKFTEPTGLLSYADEAAQKARQSTQYELAHQVAQKNAVDMLGLPPNNTAMDRARAMGFDTDAYHGTNKDIPAFDVLRGGRSSSGGGSREGALGVWSSDNSQVANDFAQFADRNLGGGNVMPLKVRLGNTNEMSKYSDVKDLLDRHTDFARPDLGVRMMQDVVHPEAARNELMQGGFDSVALRKVMTDSPDGVTPVDQYVSLDPKNIRSRFAAFDPARAHESDLLAGLAPYIGIGGLLSLGLYNRQDEQQQY